MFRCERDSEPEHRPQPPRSQSELHEEEEQRQKDVRTAEGVVAVQEEPSAEANAALADDGGNDAKAENTAEDVGGRGPKTKAPMMERSQVSGVGCR